MQFRLKFIPPAISNSTKKQTNNAANLFSIIVSQQHKDFKEYCNTVI